MVGRSSARLISEAAVKIGVSGGRDYHDDRRIFAVLDAIHSGDVQQVETVLGIAEAAIYEQAQCAGYPIACIVHGAAPGADLLAEDWAKQHEVAYRGYPARWRREGKKAGPLRNERMLAREHRPEGSRYPIALWLAFPGGAGTADMVRRCRAEGILVIEVTEK